MCLCGSVSRWLVSCHQCCKNEEGIILVTVACSFKINRSIRDVDLHQE